MMSPLKVLLSIISLFAVLGLVAIIYPDGGIHVGEYTLRYPKLTDIFEKQVASDSLSDSTAADPEEAIREMMEATKRKEFAAFSDSLKFYEDFFRKGKTRFDLPNNDPTWFDRFFLHLELASLDSNVVHIVHYGDSQLEEDFFIRSANELIPIEVKAGSNQAKSMIQMIRSDHYPDICHGMKFTAGNIGITDNICSFPHYCLFLLFQHKESLHFVYHHNHLL